MWFFLTCIFAINIIGMSIRFSLYSRWYCSILAVVAVIIAVGGAYPFAIRLNIQDISTFMNNYNTLANICVIMIFESISIFLLITHLLRSHFQNKAITWGKCIVLFPSLSGIVGLFIGLVFVLNNVSGWQLGLLTFVILTIVLTVLSVLQLFMRFIITSWQGRFDLVLILAFIQIVIAMFLPLVIGGMNVAHADQQHTGQDFFISISCFVVIAIIAFCTRKIINNFWR